MKSFRKASCVAIERKDGGAKRVVTDQNDAAGSDQFLDCRRIEYGAGEYMRLRNRPTVRPVQRVAAVPGLKIVSHLNDRVMDLAHYVELCIGLRRYLRVLRCRISVLTD